MVNELRPSLVVRVGAWLDDYWPRLLLLVGTVGVTMGAVLIGLQQARAAGRPTQDPDLMSWPWGLLIGGLFTQIVGTVGGWRGSARLSSLSAERDELKKQVGQTANDYFLQLEKELSYLANNVLGLDDTDRMSVYGHDGSAFSMLSRYSRNPNFNRPGRSIYPDDQGCIGRAWTNGSAFVGDLPDYEFDQEEYVTRLRDDWNLSADVVEGLNMKSRSVAAFAIEDTSESPQRRFAVLVIESMRTDKLKMNELRQNLFPEDDIDLIKFLVKSRSFQPSPSLARREGF